MVDATDRKQPVDLTDDDNPEWTEADFARARATGIPDAVRAAFPKTRGRPKSEQPKEAVKLRIDAPALNHLRHSGPGWQTRVNDAIVELISEGRL